MDFRFRRTKRWLAAGALVVAGLVIGLWPRASISPTNTSITNTNPARDTYASLYQAAWRQDQAQGSVLMTATLFAPTVRQALGDDTSRSETEDQLWRAVKDVSAKHIPIYVTLDSVQGAIADATITSQATLSDAGNQKYTIIDWKPLIAPTRVVNSSSGTTSQTGVLIFAAAQDIDWDTLANLKLTIKNIAEIPQRQFVWVDPGRLLRNSE